MTQQYSHRNGETQSPEVEGYYWIDYEVIPGYHMLLVIEKPIGLYKVIEVNRRFVDAVPVESVQGRWYGPIPKPEPTP